ncbi:hypothetical protein MJM04_35180 [Salmonella enterica subsp. enterica serovar Cerro]|nr:hypothetical protein [Salmonella enterica subsp. enterica serovar Cerro]
MLAIGYALVAWSGHDAGIVYMGMAAIAVGNGLFKANPSSLRRQYRRRAGKASGKRL